MQPFRGGSKYNKITAPTNNSRREQVLVATEFIERSVFTRKILELDER